MHQANSPGAKQMVVRILILYSICDITLFVDVTLYNVTIAYLQ